MKTILLELPPELARDLERVAPAKKRMRAEFIRLAIRRALDLALDRGTAASYRRDPLPSGVFADDLAGWDAENELARPSERATKRGAPKGRPRPKKHAA